MKNTLKELLLECVQEGRKGGMDPLKYPSQVLCVAEAILFTERAEDALSRGSLKSYLQDLEEQLESYTSVDLGDDGPEAKVRATPQPADVTALTCLLYRSWS